MFLDPAHQLPVIMRKSPDVSGGVKGRVRNLSACGGRDGGRTIVLDPPREAGFPDSKRVEASKQRMKDHNV